MVHVPYLAYQIHGQVSPTYILQHLSRLCTRGGRWCKLRVIKLYVMVGDIIRRGISPVGNLNNYDPRGIGVIVSLVLLMT